MPSKGYKLSEKAKENIRQGVLKRGVEARVDRNELYLLYWNKRLSAREIAEVKGVTASCVFQWLWRFKIPRRSPSEFTKLAYQKQPYPLIGYKSPFWKGGRTKHQSYIYVHIYPDNPFYSMAHKGGWVAEHRLVMAQYLGRPLEKWEIVHHKNDAKEDNKIENLELHPTQASHVTYTMFKRELNNRDKEIRLLKWQINQLNEVIYGRKEAHR